MGSEEKESEGNEIEQQQGWEGGLTWGEMGELRNEKEFKMARVLSDFA